MNNNVIVSPSSQVDTTLPSFIAQTYREFVKFMTAADESEERFGFSQDLLQNLQRYRDFTTYNKQIVKVGVLSDTITAADTELSLESGEGFPEENGVIYIDDEVILYRKREGSLFTELQRGASATVILPTFTTEGVYKDTIAAPHTKGAAVQNTSVLFLTGFLENIYKSYAPGINPQRVSSEINNASFLENIQDFFRSKGSKLGIKALFKILFAENDVEVTYPGDRMIIPSKSTWSEGLILRTVPQPINLVDPSLRYVLPTKVMNSVITLRSYDNDSVIARSVCDFVSSYPYDSDIQYEMYLNKDKIEGNFIANPSTRLTRSTTDSPVDNNLFTLTVESTVGFPDSGTMFIGTEGIEYESKSNNQFFKCKRGKKGIESHHAIGARVYGPYYIRADVELDGLIYTSISYPLGLVEKVDIVEGGLLHTINDDVFVNGPGRDDPRAVPLASFIENYDDQLVAQAQPAPQIADVDNLTAGVTSVYFNSEFIFAATNGLPYYAIGPFSDNGSVGPNLIPEIDNYYAIPRDKTENPDLYGITSKGTDEIGVAVDGVPYYSETSNFELIQGIISGFHIDNRGTGYENPTILIEPGPTRARAEVVNGQINEVTIIPFTASNYDNIPAVRVTSGEGAQFELSFDIYGRITDIEITEGGQYYKDVPAITVFDSTGRGRGATISCTVNNGEIATATVITQGIDYNPLTTVVKTTPVGSGAEIHAEVESYNYNRYQGVINNPNYTFDSGNGFLYGDTLSTFGYVCSPTQLRQSLGDDGTKHSPIIGWAFDGNPIYGPYGFTNLKNDSGGVRLMQSGYVLRPNRSGLGTNPPNEGSFNPFNGTFPMGTFTQDFIYQPGDISDIFLQTDSGDSLTTDGGLDLSIDSGSISSTVLDRNNGRICNTPEYPEELYPDGVYCYFTTIDESFVPTFPYIIGTTFHNRPLSQVKQPEPETAPDALRATHYVPTSYDNTLIEYNLDLVERYRNPYLSETKRDVSLKIADVSTGGISSIIVESGLPATTKVGDTLSYEIPADGAGMGAIGEVQFVTGEPITSAKGELVETYLRSHRQLIDLSSYKGSKSFVFVEDTLVTETSGAIGRVRKWDTSTYLLEVQCLTYYLFKWSNPDSDPYFIEDNRGVRIQIPDKPSEVYKELYANDIQLEATRPNRMLMGGAAPSIGIGGIDNEAGDLWWDMQNGRMYVYYQDPSDDAQWVETQPVGMTPMGEEASAFTSGTTKPTVNAVYNTGANNTVTISLLAPDERSDGTPNRNGDLWWSALTGNLYVFYDETIATSGVTSQWVSTEPNATVPGRLPGLPGEFAADELYPELPNAALDRGNIFTKTILVTISATAPTTHSDGSAIEIGDLWWCSVNGKMYIYYSDAPGTATESVQWVQCNPVGSLTSQYGEDEPIKPIPPGPTPPQPTPPPRPDPDDPYPGGDIPTLPELADQKLLWFRDMTNFLPTDQTNFVLGAPDVQSLIENAKIDSVGTPDNANGVFIRGFNDKALTLPDGSRMVNDTRAVYVVNTSTPHKLIPGDTVFIENSLYTEMNAVHEVARAGIVVPADIGVTVAGGQVTALTINSPGKYYTESFYISFSGGGGVGAFGYATVSDISLGGEVIKVEVLAGGAKYTEAPTPILGNELTQNQYEIYVNNFYGDDSVDVKYSAAGDAVENTAAYIKTSSTGTGYNQMPAAIGLIKKEADRGSFIINGGTVAIDGQSIRTYTDPLGNGITVVNGGARYVNPVAYIEDRLGSGSGATAEVTVSNGVVTEVKVLTGGSGYIEPVLKLIEQDGKFISLTNDIGKIRSTSVLNPGRDISIDRSLRPELQITTRCIIRYVDNVRGGFIEGQEVFQGTEEMKLVTATVVSYDDKIQQLTLQNVEGVLRAGELIKDNLGTTATVLLQGEADCRTVVSGTSEPEGKFIDDTSMVGRKYAVIQDSKKYQRFSYEIKSPLVRSEYENLVKDIIHPTGFVMYSQIDLNNSVDTKLDVINPGFYPKAFDPSAQEEDVLQTDGYAGQALGANGYGGPIALATD